MRVLAIGAGSIGKRHLANLEARGDVQLAAFDPDPRRLESLGREHPSVAISTDPKEAWSFKPDVVLITCPTSHHMEWALEAARHGSDIFIEKPLSDRLDGIEELQELAKQEELITMVGCNMRFHWGVSTVKRLVDEGVLGRVVHARIEFGQYLPDWHPDEDYRLGYSARSELGGGVILDAIHELDYAMWLFGKPTEVVSMATRGSSLEIDTEDVAEVLLRFDGGPIVSVHMDYVARTYTRGCRITGEEGTVLWDMAEGAVRLYSASLSAWQRFDPPAGYEGAAMYADEMAYFLERVRTRTPAMNDLAEAKSVLEVALEAKGGIR